MDSFESLMRMGASGGVVSRQLSVPGESDSMSA